MAKIKSVFVTILSILFIGVIVYLVIANYSLLFSKTVKGMVMSVKTVELPIALMTTRNMAPGTEVFSFAVAIKDAETKEIFTAKSEERQWAVVAPGQCVEAVFLPYPPWDLRRRGTYFGARLVSLRECEPGMMPAPAAPAPAQNSETAPAEPAVPKQ